MLVLLVQRVAKLMKMIFARKDAKKTDNPHIWGNN